MFRPAQACHTKKSEFNTDFLLYQHVYDTDGIAHAECLQLDWSAQREIRLRAMKQANTNQTTALA